MFHVPGSAVFFSRHCPVEASLFLLPGPGFHVPCSMFPVPLFSFPGYRPAPLGFAASGRFGSRLCIRVLYTCKPKRRGRPCPVGAAGDRRRTPKASPPPRRVRVPPPGTPISRLALPGLRSCRRCPHRRSFPGGTARDSASGGTGGTWTRVSPNSGLPRWGSAVSSSRSRVPCSMFPVPPFSFPGLPRWGSAVSSSRSRVPCSMFPVPPFSFLPTGYWLQATGYRLPACRVGAILKYTIAP